MRRFAKEGWLIFELDFRSRLPIYEQLVERFKELIIKKVLLPDQQLPSVRALAKELTINPNTIQRAYAELEVQGYVYSVMGKGNFVSPALPNTNGQRLKELEQELLKLVAEMMYLGMKKQAIIKSITALEISTGGGEIDDSAKSGK